jgi:hypothetical protein
MASHFIRTLVPVFVAGYLTAIGWFLFKHVQGDSAHSLIGYFWTWDMYPNYTSESSRRIVVGETRGGDYVQLVPGPRDRFRWGRHGDATRIDLNRHPAHLRAAAERAAAEYRRTSTHGLSRVYVIERYWPARRNLARGPSSDAAVGLETNRDSFRIAAEAAVGAAGDLQWDEPE